MHLKIDRKFSERVSYLKLYRYNYITIDPQSYCDELRYLINSSGVVYFKRDQGFEVWKDAENSYISAFINGDYLSFKNQDYEKNYPYAVKMYKKMPPSSKFF